MEDDDDCLEVLPNPTPPHHATLASSHSHVCVRVSVCAHARARVGTGVGSSFLVVFTSECDPGWRETTSVLQHNPRRHLAGLNRAVNAPAGWLTQG